MNHRARRSFLGAGLALAAAALGLAKPSVAQSIALTPCHVRGVDGEVKCGTFAVRENRADARSRIIPLRVIVVPARATRPLADPVFMVSPGGPGTTNSEALPPLAWNSWMRDRRDIVIVDLRGTSGPSRLDCDMSDDLGTLFPRKTIDACRAALERKADLRYYTTPAVVEDFDQVRRALGYRKVNLWAASWGTRVEFLWLRMHSETVRSAILEGSAPVSFLNPLPHARSAQDALDSLFAECQRQAPCHGSFPHIRAELDSLEVRLERAPAKVHGTASLTWPEFAEALRVMTYNAPRSQRVPLLVHRAFEGDYDTFASAAMQSNRQLRSSLRFGFLLSITCTEDVARIDPATIERETAHTYLGDTRVREQIAACRDWPRGSLAPNYGDPVRSTVPVFLLSGSVDPVAPAHFAAEAARYLPNSVHVIAPGGHVPGGPCIDAMERTFLDSADPRAVNTTCVASMSLPEFIVR